MLKNIKNLKECSAESEMWKQKYRILKNEFFELKTKFDEYKNNFLRDVQDKFFYESDAFADNLKIVRERFSSNSESEIAVMLDKNI